MKNEVS